LLGREEAKEIQARLRSFGFNPGPVDGVPGGLTEGAITRYQQNRGPISDRQGRSRIAGEAPPGSRAQDRPAPRGPLLSAGPFAPAKKLQSIRIHTGRWRSPRPMAGLAAAMMPSVGPATSTVSASPSGNAAQLVRRALMYS
jgi:peptidoglycan hydrolase-like protein with peptidoglycan-binding domain